VPKKFITNLLTFLELSSQFAELPLSHNVKISFKKFPDQDDFRNLMVWRPCWKIISGKIFTKIWSVFIRSC